MHKDLPDFPLVIFHMRAYLPEEFWDFREPGKNFLLLHSPKSVSAKNMENWRYVLPANRYIHPYEIHLLFPNQYRVIL